jgi:hypothetical protein
MVNMKWSLIRVLFASAPLLTGGLVAQLHRVADVPPLPDARDIAGGTYSPVKVTVDGPCYPAWVVVHDPGGEGAFASVELIGVWEGRAHTVHFVDYPQGDGQREWSRGLPLRVCKATEMRGCPPHDDRGGTWRLQPIDGGPAQEWGQTLHTCGGA